MDEYLRLTPSPTGAVSERMQALLSQAVEEQVTEQREVQSLLSEVRTVLAEVQRNPRGGPDGGADMRAELANHAGESRAQLSVLDERLEAIVRAVSTSAQVLQGISSQLERVTELIREEAANAGRTEPVVQVRREVADLRERVDAVESSVRGDVAALEQRLAGHAEALQGATEASTRTVADHVDNAVLVLAEALLRRPGAGPVPDAPGSAVSWDVQPHDLEHHEPPAPVEESEPASGGDEPATAEDVAPEPAAESVSEPASDTATGWPDPPATAAPEDGTTGPAGDADQIPDDDPLWGASYRISEENPAAEAPVSGTSTWEREPGRGDEPVTPTAYDDPLVDLPTADDPRPAAGVPAAYDLGKSLLGQRSDVDPRDGDGSADDDDATGPGADGSSRRRPWWRPTQLGAARPAGRSWP